MMLWILDASINISMEPFRAFVGDKLPTSTTNTGLCHANFFYWCGCRYRIFLPYIFTNFSASVIRQRKALFPIPLNILFILVELFIFYRCDVDRVYHQRISAGKHAEMGSRKRRTKGVWKGFVEIGRGIGNMPKTMVQLAIVSFLPGWLFSPCGCIPHLVLQQMHLALPTPSKSLPGCRRLGRRNVYGIQWCIRFSGIFIALVSCKNQKKIHAFNLPWYWVALG